MTFLTYRSNRQSIREKEIEYAKKGKDTTIDSLNEAKEILSELNEEIQEIFWSNKSNNESRLHNAISRLRGVFENIPSIEVQRYEKVGYQLYIRRI